MKSTPVTSRHHTRARATGVPRSPLPARASSAKFAMASKPRKESTATDTALSSSAVSEKARSPVTGESQPRAGPSCTSTTSAAATNTSSTRISMASTRNPTTAARRTPERLSAVVTTTARAVQIHWSTSGTSCAMAMPENR